MRFRIACVIFLLAFCGCFALQISIIDPHTFTDQDLWQAAVVTFSHGHLLSPDDNAYGYPGTTFLIPAGLAAHFGVDPWTALKYAVVTIFSLSVASVALMLYLLRPRELWWLAGSIIITFQSLFYQSTAPSAIASILLPLMALCALYLYEHRQSRSQWPEALTGVVCGFALATRLDISAVFCVAIALLMLIERDRRLWLLMGVAFVTFVLLDPFMWWPIQYALGMYAKLHLHFFDKNAAPDMYTVLKRYAMAALAFAFGVLLALVAPKVLPIPRRFLVWLIAATLVIWMMLLRSDYHPLWYFFPLIFIWQVFAPLIVAAPFQKGVLPKHSIFNSRYAYLLALFILPALQMWLAFMPPAFL